MTNLFDHDEPPKLDAERLPYTARFVLGMVTTYPGCTVKELHGAQGDRGNLTVTEIDRWLVRLLEMGRVERIERDGKGTWYLTPKESQNAAGSPEP